MRNALDGLYRISGVLAAFCLVLICLIVAGQVAGRVVDAIALAVAGRSFGFYIPSAAEFSGFLFAASSFLALANTLRHGDHIRVLLCLSRFSDRARRGAEIWCLIFAAGFAGFFAAHAILLVLDSRAFGEVSVGIVPVDLWIPQGFMALGLVVLTIAALDDLVAVFCRRDPSYRKSEQVPDEAIRDSRAGFP